MALVPREQEALDTSGEKLRERIKELQCLYAVSRIAQKEDLGFEGMVNAFVAAIPQGWQWPEVLWAGLVLDGRSYGTTTTTTNALHVPIVVEGVDRGVLTVGYPTLELPGTAELFLAEELLLMDKLAVELARIVERHEQREHRVRMDQRLRNTDRLTVLGELTAGIAHELNTPLGNVLGFAELLKKGEDDAARQADLQRIIDSALVGRDIVKKLMYFSCEMPSQFHLLDLNEQVRQTVRLLQHRLDEQAIRTTLELDSTPLIARIDAVQFAQVMSNLILNALSAMSREDHLRISTQRSDGHAIIRVQDSGSGIAAEDLPRIFQPFFTTKPTGEGTGLGLAVVHGIMKGHGGHISASSTPGAGALFTLTFPLPQNV